MAAVHAFLLSLILLGASAPAWAQPRVVVLLRHGEESESSGVHLDERGFRRAEALPERIRALLAGVPVAAVYAQGPKADDSSLRSVETITPTARSFGLEVEDRFEKWEAKKLVKELRSREAELRGKAVVIAWGSDELDGIAERLGYEPPKKGKFAWDKAVYDRFWVLSFDEDGKPVRFSQLAQQLLPGDASGAKDYSVPLTDCNAIVQRQRGER